MPAGLRLLVVDDEQPAREELAYLLRGFATVQEVREAEDAGACLDHLAAGELDALFSDIRMPGLDGLHLARVVREMRPDLPVVFVTAFDEHAVEAFQIPAFDYLLKPVRADRLGQTLERLQAARQTPDNGQEDHPSGQLDRLAVLHRGQIVLVPVEDIRVAEVEGDRVMLMTDSGRYPARLSLQELEARLAGHGFMRVHRHFIVNLHHVRAVDPFFNGTYLLRLDRLPELSVPVSRRHGPELRQALGL